MSPLLCRPTPLSKSLLLAQGSSHFSSRPRGLTLCVPQAMNTPRPFPSCTTAMWQRCLRYSSGRCVRLAPELGDQRIGRALVSVWGVVLLTKKKVSVKATGHIPGHGAVPGHGVCCSTPDKARARGFMHMCAHTHVWAAP